MWHKVLLGNSGAVQILVKLLRTTCIEVREQAILAIGFMAKGAPDVRDLIFSLGGLEALLLLVNANSTIQLAQKVSWVLSVLSGWTMPEGRRGVGKQAVQNIMQSFSFLLYWKDDTDIITHSLLGLTHLLPLVQIDQKNKQIWERVVKLLTHSQTKVKRAGLICIKSIIQSNDMQLQFIVEQKLIVLLSEILAHSDIGIKIEACYVITILAKKGYYFVWTRHWISLNSNLNSTSWIQRC